jgi:hypothetical protein
MAFSSSEPKIMIWCAVPVREEQYIPKEVLPALKYSWEARAIVAGMPMPPASGGNARLWKPAST